MALFYQRFRERFDHIREAAGFGEWQALRSYEENSHVRVATSRPQLR